MESWFNNDRAMSVALLRISVALAAFAALSYVMKNDYAAFFAANQHLTYTPKGILAFFGTQVPSPAFFNFFKWFGLIANFMACIGLFARTSMFFGVVSGMIVVAINYSFIPGNCHGYNIILLSQIPFIFVKASNFLSIDAWLNRHKKKDHSSDAWVVPFSQFVVASMFFCAMLNKLYGHGHPFAWLNADNFRALLLLRYLSHNESAPWIVKYIINSQFLCTVLPYLNVLSQGLPMLSCFFLNRPYLRLALGTFFIFEVIGLGILMGLWNLYWIVLFVVFVDWDYFLNLLFRKEQDVERKILPVLTSFRKKALVTAGVSIWFSVILALTLNPKLERHWNTFPFSSFSMYSVATYKEQNSLDYYKIGWTPQNKLLNRNQQRKLHSFVMRTISNRKSLDPKKINNVMISSAATLSAFGIEPLDSVTLSLIRYRLPKFPEVYDKKIIEAIPYASFDVTTKKLTILNSDVESAHVN
jgi:hypothetical protein